MGDIGALRDSASRATSAKAASSLATNLTGEGVPKNANDHGVWASQTKSMQKPDGGGMDIISHVQVVAHESINKFPPGRPL